MHENAARALQYYEDLPRRSGRPELRLVDSEPRTRRRMEAETSPQVEMGSLPLTDSSTSAGSSAPAERLATGDAFTAAEPFAAARPAPEPRRDVARRRDAEPRSPRDRRPARSDQRLGGELEHRAARPRPRPRRQPLAPPRPQAAAPRLAGRPDRVAMWAVLLGFFLTAVAAATGHG